MDNAIRHENVSRSGHDALKHELELARAQARGLEMTLRESEMQRAEALRELRAIEVRLDMAERLMITVGTQVRAVARSLGAAPARDEARA